MNQRSETTGPAGTLPAGYLVPVNAFPVEAGESGMVTQNIVLETRPIAGRLLSQMKCELITVFATVESMMALLEPDNPNAGLTEAIRKRVLAGEELFPLEEEGEISRMMKIEPIPIAGKKYVDSRVRLAHNAAINFIRRTRYTYAVQLLANSTAITPALVSQSILSMMNGVLDPDEHVNGAINLSLPTMALPVSGLYATTSAQTTSGGAGLVDAAGGSGTGKPIYNAAINAEKNAETSLPNIYAQFDGITAGGINLTGLKNAQSIDRLTRAMRTMIDANPAIGEEVALRYAHNLSVDRSDQPFFLYSEDENFGLPYQTAADGSGMVDEVELTKPFHTRRIAFPVPRTDLGGVAITFIAVKPDEVIERQPHPIFTKSWTIRNQAADQLKLDPVPVLMREVSADCPQASETTVAFYTGHNELLKRYVNYGWNRTVDPETVESKNAIWQYAIPISATPESILYPEELETYPWVDQHGDVVTYSVTTNVALQTPIVFGPTPIEEIDIINDEDIYEEQD